MTLATALYGVGIKSIQAGTITVASPNTSNTATISSVNTAKSVVLYNGISASANVSIGDAEASVQLTNATTVTATRGTGNYSLTVAYTVVEFN